jgi:GH24 family phage-related lysozyme (muramidase)
MSEQGLKLLGQREGYPKDAKGNAVAYPDAGGVWTIGRGITRINGKPVTQGMTLSKGEEESEFRKQVETKYAQMVRVSLAGAPISQNQFDALVSLAYNHERSGKAAAAKFASGQQLTPEDFTRTATVKGQPHAGLQARRLGEYNQFQGVSFQPRASGARSGAVLASATTAAGGGRSAGAPPTVIVNAPVSTIAQGAAPAVIPIPLRVDPLDATVRAIRNTSGSVLG